MKKKGMMTRLTHAGENVMAKKIAASVSVPKVNPIYMSSVFSFDDVASLDAVYDGSATGYVYSRMSNPGTDTVEEVLAQAEDCDGALVFSSGMAAIITSILAHVKTGDHVLSSNVLYGGVYDFFKNELPRFGIEVTLADFEKEDVQALLRPNTKIIYTETISNPLMVVEDIPNLARIAHAHGCKLIVDNTFATPAVTNILKLGADIAVYSATKYLGGHSDILGGAITANAANIAHLRRYFTLYGSIMSPFDAWLLTRSLRTLDLRMERHCKNAQKVAEFLEQHPKIEKVYYPGLPSSPYHERAKQLFVEGRFGGMLSADIAGGEKGATNFISACSTIKLVPSLAGVSTTISYPAKTSHRAYSPQMLAQVGISTGQLRFSVGLENLDDILEEFDSALKKI
jgi:methionine-gamma-lyase